MGVPPFLLPKTMRRHHRLAAPELLEARIAPATLLPGGKAVTYLDEDGDLVTIRITKGAFQNPSAAGQTQFVFGPTPTGVGEQLEVLNLSHQSAFDRAGLSIVATPSDPNGDGRRQGDGVVNVGYINATGVDLGAVVVRGDLGAIDAGDEISDPALASLSVQSLGREGLATGAPNLSSDLLGPVGTIKVAGDVSAASIAILGGDQFATLRSLSIGGSIFGGADANTGEIFVQGTLGKAKIGGSIFGGVGESSGTVQAAKFGAVAVSGSILGGSGTLSGGIFARDAVASIVVDGSLLGGSGVSSGRIAAQKIGPVRISGSISGGDPVDVTLSAENSGSITAGSGSFPGAGTLGAVMIGGSILGSEGGNSATINAATSIASVAVGGALSGGVGDFSGAIASPIVGLVRIAGSVFGGEGDLSGGVYGAVRLAGLSISGALIGGAGIGSGSVRAGGSPGAITVGGAMIGGAGLKSGAIFSQTGADFSVIAIGGYLQGGSGVESGEIFTDGSIRSVSIVSSVFGGSASGAGMIRAGETLVAVKIGGSIVGGSTENTLLQDSGTVQARRIGSVFVGGSVFAGSIGDAAAGGILLSSGAIRAEFDLASVVVRGNLEGSNTHPVIISAGGMEAPGVTDVAIRSLMVGGRTFNAAILAGYSLDVSASYLGRPVNADAQIGTVTIGGDLIASSVIAGLAPGSEGYFGDATDTKINGVRDRTGIMSKIGAIVIGGRAQGTLESDDAFRGGIGAEQLSSLKLGGASVIPLKVGAKTDTFAVGEAYALGSTRGIGVADGRDLHAYEV